MFPHINSARREMAKLNSQEKHLRNTGRLHRGEAMYI